MRKTKKRLNGLSLKWDALFFRNLTLILATIFIWRGVWNFLDHYFLPNNFEMSNLIIILIGILLLFVFDSEVEEVEREIAAAENFEAKEHKHKHLLNDHI